MSETVNVAIIGVGNCASSLVQGVEYYRNAKPDEFVPGLMHVNLGGYHVNDIRFTAAFDIDARKVGHDLSAAIFSEPNNTLKLRGCSAPGVPVQRGMTHDGLGQVPERDHREGTRPDRGHHGNPARDRDRRRGQLPAGRFRAGDQVVRRAGPRRRMRVRELHPGVHRPGAVLAGPLRRAWRADHRRRHQEPGRRDDRAPHPGAPDERARRTPRAHQPAELRRQHATS